MCNDRLVNNGTNCLCCELFFVPAKIWWREIVLKKRSFKQHKQFTDNEDFRIGNSTMFESYRRCTLKDIDKGVVKCAASWILPSAIYVFVDSWRWRGNCAHRVVVLKDACYSSTAWEIIFMATGTVKILKYWKHRWANWPRFAVTDSNNLSTWQTQNHCRCLLI